MTRYLPVILSFILASCATNQAMDSPREYSGPIDCDEVVRDIENRNTAAFKGHRASTAIELCAEMIGR